MNTNRRLQNDNGADAQTSRTASRGAIYWIVPIAVVALAIMMAGVHFVGTIK